MDTLRKVLYGGYRSTDSTTSTVLQRVYVPQDAHSWGKEYTSIAVDGYDIRKYTPFALPIVGSGLRHLFASTTLSDNGVPLLRYALNNSNRIWSWVAKERPVVDDSIATAGTGHPGHPGDHTAFQNIVNIYANDANKMGDTSWTNWEIRNHLSQKYPSPNKDNFGAIDGEGNPYGTGYGYTDSRATGVADQNNYLAIFKGTLHVTTGGTYQFGVDGDDAVELIIDGTTITGSYGAHSAAGSPQSAVAVSLSAGTHTVEFRMEEASGDDKYYLYWNGADSGNVWKIISNNSLKDLTLSTYRLSLAASTISNLEVRVKVCDPSVGVEANCKLYPDGQYKPTGLLQRHGEPKRMYFGLMTGSYAKNTSGGVLRKRVGDINDEIITNTGQFQPSVNGIIQTLNKMRIYGFRYSDHAYEPNCGWISTRSMNEGECRAWGNPVAEMMYETLRYFAGKTGATGAFDYTPGSANDDDSKLFSPLLAAPYNSVGLPKAAWKDPYDKVDGFDSCSKPFMLVLSDINPSYDSDQLPGVASTFGSGITGDLSPALPVFDAEALASQISAEEPEGSGNKYIGESNGSSLDMICSPKTVTGFGAIRGLCPEEPTKKGGYYSAAAAYYGHKNDLRPDLVDASGSPYDNKVTTYAVGLASPLPRIELTLGPDKKQITLVPFGKTVASEGDTTAKKFVPTNTIVDFFVDTITPTYGKFRINYEDVEQGADHDMDAIVIYEYQLIDDDDNNVTDPVNATKVKISLDSHEYAAGSFIQHLGYIISGTDADGPYLEVHDKPSNAAVQDVLYAFDTPPAGSPAGTKLPMITSRIFRPSTDSGVTPAQLLKNPLWYAAKWGGFDDKNGDGIPNGTDGDEWDKDKDGSPDTYFYVTNPLRLEEELNKSFASILNQASSGTAASVVSNTRSGEGAVYQSIFYPTITDSTANANTVSWVGQVHSFLVDAYGNMREDTNGNDKLDVKGPDLNGNGRVYHEDINMNCKLDYQTTDTDGNGVLDTEDTNGNGELDTEFPGSCPSNNRAYLSQLDAIIRYDANAEPHRYYDVNGDGILQDREIIWNVADAVTSTNPLNYLWNSSEWLNSINDIDIVAQRSTYISAENRRYIFTWVDGNGDKVVNAATEIKDFTWPLTPPALADLAVTTNFYPYLHLYPSFGNKPAAISALSTTDFADFLIKETKREIQYIRGLDDVDTEGIAQPLKIGVNDIAGTELRSRHYDGKTWRLGDIAYSTPTVVSKPSEGYHLLYRDNTYADFAAQYADRRTVIYTGANDGMLHAFNGGFYDSYHQEFCREINAGYNPYDGVTGNDDGCKTNTDMPELGAELWAYIPFNLLPHLHWLTESEYGHVYYVDQKPRIFDAKIFPADAVGGLHPHGWGTVMVVGMRFGGASIKADIDKTITTDDLTDPVMKSAFLIFDITDPEIKPTLLGEITMPEMGFSTSYPTMVVMKDGDHNGKFDDYNDLNPATGENRWFLAFGSGPADATGDPDPTVLATAGSSQMAKFYMLDMVKLASKNEIWTLTDGPTRHGVLTQGLHWYSELDSNSFVSDPITVDYNLDYNADVLYYGTVSTGTSRWEGKMRRIIIDDLFDPDEDQDPSFWEPDSVLFNAEQPITAAPTVALDGEGRNWVFFGTGRYFVPLDGSDLSLQSYYGIKEPISSTEPERKTWHLISSKSDLVDTTNYEVFTDSARTVDRNGFKASWSDVVAEQAQHDGWFIDFVDDTGNQLGERNLGQAVLLGGALIFTTFIPSEDVCEAGGESWLWSQFYTTGTSYFDAILGSDTVTFDGQSLGKSRRKVSLGQGLATSPNVHVGSEDGSKAFVQTSTGAIQVIDQNNPFEVKSGMRSWKESD
ncbi:hypothetical protein FCL47_08485 [Desulfopila sp. IMCC35006]|uniref:PA14 domain-containing protein n=1 Tax=Desulfopila sp. IMCC35006 TaxID=2569542 RepID=UPI0010ACF8A1|nr:PA14 domain-containing protein [Desulfopila sp. IMCC35006]TKB26444.1 hypothetical protein FCL47_08485 [Desulfopila sp. IMCC35006]